MASAMLRDPSHQTTSKFDLPVKFHASIATEAPDPVDWDWLQPPQSRLSHIDPHFLETRFSISKNFGFISNLALRKQFLEMVHKLHVIYDSSVCMLREFGIIEAPNNAFGWRLADFMERRRVTNAVWVDLLKRDTPPKCLELLKFKCDLDELLPILRNLFVCFDPTQEEYSVGSVLQELKEIKEFLNYFEDFVAELKKNQNTLVRYLSQQATSHFVKLDSGRAKKRLDLEEHLINQEVWSPIEVRYQLRWYQTLANQVEYKWDGQEQNLEKQLLDYSDLTNTEKYCAQSTMNMFYSQIEKYKQGFVSFTNQYNTDYEALEQKIQYMKLSLEKLREQRKFFIEQIQRFHEEIELLYERDAREKENRRRMAESLANAIAAKKKAKEGRKGKKKK